ncbi:MAG: BlaI/MecI/CopY family transcriptional regulator [Theionarchaea archaeon]|nr:BlaI/MecI/CopY family transcriptional regulator [Theionarchaea archaeon]
MLMLGPLEREVLSCMNQIEQGTVRDVYKFMRKEKNIAYTTVSTTLERLFEKEYLSRGEDTGRGGTRYVYSIKDVKPKLAKMFVDEFISIFGKSGMSALHDEITKHE